MTPEAGASSGVGDGMLGRLLDATAGRFVAGASGPQEAVQALILLILAVFAVKNVFDFLKTWLAARVEQGVTRDLRNQVHDHLLELDLVFFGRTRIGQIVSRLTHDVELVRTLFTREFMRGISAAFEVVAVVVLMVAVSPSLTLLSVAVLPGMVVIWGPMLKKLRREDGRVLDQAAEVNARIQETFSGIRLVKGSAAEDYERGRFHALTGRYFRTFLRTERVRALAAPVTEMVAALGTIVILWYGTRLVLVQGDLTGPAFMGFVALSTKLYRPVKYLSRLPAMIQPALVGRPQAVRVSGRCPPPFATGRTRCRSPAWSARSCSTGWGSATAREAPCWRMFRLWSSAGRWRPWWGRAGPGRAPWWICSAGSSRSPRGGS